MASSVIKKESSICLQCKSTEVILNFTARYDIAREERVKVDDEHVIQVPCEVDLTISDMEGSYSALKYQRIQDDIKKDEHFLEKFVDSPPLVMKTVRRIICYLLEKDTIGIHLVPENEQLLITKVDERGRKSIFSYRSDPEKDMITVSECEQINNFVGVHPKIKWLMSILWLLSELAMKQFGQQGSSPKKPKQG